MRVAETMLATSNNSKRDGSGRREGLICFTAFGREGVSKVARRQPNGGFRGGSSEVVIVLQGGGGGSDRSPAGQLSRAPALHPCPLAIVSGIISYSSINLFHICLSYKINSYLRRPSDHIFET